MPCGCRGRGLSRGKGWGPNEVLGYEYISPQGVSSRPTVNDPLLSLVEARAEQRAHGGGTIKAVRQKATA
jgi:hypothetical protein